MLGFDYRNIEFPEKVDCQKAKPFNLSYALVVAHIKGFQKPPETSIECVNFLGQEHFKLLEYFKLAPQTDEEAKRFFKKNKFSKLKRDKLMAWRQLKSDFFYPQELLDKLRHYQTFIIKDMDKEIVKSTQRRILNIIRPSTEDLIQNIAFLNVAMSTNNQTWALNSVDKIILSTPLAPLVGHLDIVGMEKKEKELWEKIIYRSVLGFKKFYGDDPHTSFLADYLLPYLPRNEEDKWRHEFGANWSLGEIRNLYKGWTNGIRIAPLWYRQLSTRTSAVEIQAFLNTAYQEKRRDEYTWRELWLFDAFTPDSILTKQKVGKKLAEMINSDRPLQVLTALHGLENPQMAKEMALWNDKLKAPKNDVLKDIFRGFLDKGQMVHFSLYNLILLGENDPELLWWLVL